MRILYASIKIDITYNEEKPITIKRFPTAVEIEEGVLPYKMVDEERITFDNEVEIKIYKRKKKSFVTVISGGQWNFKEYHPPGVNIDIHMVKPEFGLKNDIAEIVRILCNKHMKPCKLYSSQYSISCTINDCKLNNKIVQNFLENFIKELNKKIENYNIINKEEKIIDIPEEKSETGSEETENIIDFGEIPKDEQETILFCDNCGKEVNVIDSYIYDSSNKKQLRLCYNCYRIYSDKDDIKTIKNEQLNKKIIIGFIGIFILSFLLVYGYIYLNDYNSQLDKDIGLFSLDIKDSINDFNDLEIEKTSLESSLKEYNSYLIENESELNILLSGDEFSLHNPMFSELSNFIEEDNSIDEKKMVENAKKQGLRCAYVQVGIPDGAYELVGFDTIDMGMVYFEGYTDYRVFPEIGESYVNCVEGSPYYSADDDTIEEIKLFW